LCAEQAIGFLRDRLAVLGGKLNGATRIRVRVGTAADRNEGDSIGMIAFDGSGGHPSPIAMHRIKLAAQRCAVAGIADEDAAQRAVWCTDPQQRHFMIHRSIRGAAIFGESRQAFAPRQAPRFRSATASSATRSSRSVKKEV
jgi:hypothetical protein